MDAFKHVNNSVYLTYLEETRDEWFLEVLGNADLLNDFVLAGCAIDFRSPLTQDDGEVAAEVPATPVATSSVTIAELVTAVLDRRLSAEAEWVVVHIDRG